MGVSLSARRAWIEITRRTLLTRFYPSLSARRAWIEIAALAPEENTTQVALRKESVDRNQQLIDTSKDIISRSPQGERG